MRFATPDEIATWNELIVSNPNGGDPFQTTVFAGIKASQGWRPQYIVYEFGKQKIACLYLTRRVPLLGELWYAPKGPGITAKKELEQILDDNKKFASQHPAHAIFAFKLDPEVPKAVGHPKELRKVHNIQPNACTVIVDLSPGEDHILTGFRQRARRAIRQAQAAGVTVTPAEPTEANYQRMYALYKSTGERAGFHVRNFAYHKTLWQQWIAAGQGQLFFAHHQGHVVAGAFVAFVGKKGLYKDGASDRAALKNGAAHLLQWEIMRWLKARGVEQYDLHGTPPPDQLDNKTHPFYGLGLFKTSFSQQITEYVGTLDQVINKTAYARWGKFGERAAQSLEYRLRGRTFY